MSPRKRTVPDPLKQKECTMCDEPTGRFVLGNKNTHICEQCLKDAIRALGYTIDQGGFARMGLRRVK